LNAETDFRIPRLKILQKCADYHGVFGSRAAAGPYPDALFARLPVAFLWTTDRDLRVTSLVGGALHLLGDADDRPLVGRPISEFGGSHLFADLHAAALEGNASSFTTEWLGWVFDIRIEPVFGPRGVEGTAGLALDATKRALAERALEQAEQRLSELAAEPAVA
jgi:hypothetical protein